MDKISVIVPIYNVESYIRQSLDSIINQTYKNLEIILVDDGSPDNCGKICDEYALKDNRIKVLHIKNSGLAVARNTGLDIATGEFIGFIDPDDFFELDMYETLYNAITKTNAGLAVCNWYKGYENNWKRNTDFPDKEILTSNEALEFFYNHMYVWNKLYRKDVVGNLRQKETYAEDVHYTFTTFTRIERVVCVDKYLCYYRKNPTSRLHTKKFKKDYLFFLKVLNMEIEYAEKNELFDLKEKIFSSKMEAMTCWISYIVAENNKQNVVYAKQIIKLLRPNILKFLKAKWSLDKKIFALFACINFDLVSFLYRLYLKLINIF